MKNIRFYIVLGVVLSVSVVLLGLSYSAYSGTTEYQIGEVNNQEMRVVYSNTDRLYIIQNTKTAIGITNLTEVSKTYVLSMEEEKNIPYQDVYLKIDNQEEIKVERQEGKQEIYRGELAPYGTDGDYKLHTVEVYSKSNENAVFAFSVSYVEEEMESEGEGFVGASE